jgi:ubiquinone/menaquinone biosynthesis C-methylase UbiE
VGFYSRVIFPWLCDCALGTPYVAEHRQQLLAGACGNILEIGFGTGLNLPHYPESVRKITIIDPNPGMHRRAQRRIQESGLEVDQRLISGEQLPFNDGTFDYVISTFTLCSIEDVQRAVEELYRVLRPGGRFLFLEHGLSPDPRIQRWQERLNWLQRHMAGNCHLDRNIRSIVSRPQFAKIEVSEFYLEQTPRMYGSMYQGVATK